MKTYIQKQLSSITYRNMLEHDLIEARGWHRQLKSVMRMKSPYAKRVWWVAMATPSHSIPALCDCSDCNRSRAKRKNHTTV